MPVYCDLLYDFDGIICLNIFKKSFKIENSCGLLFISIETKKLKKTLNIIMDSIISIDFIIFKNSRGLRIEYFCGMSEERIDIFIFNNMRLALCCEERPH
jgi:hypothetical protein